MSSPIEVLCCVPVLLLWLGPAALLVYCLAFGGWSRLAGWYRSLPGGPDRK